MASVGKADPGRPTIPRGVQFTMPEMPVRSARVVLSAAETAVAGNCLRTAPARDTTLVKSVSKSRIGSYLGELKERFEPSVVVDMLCLLRLRCELSIRAKGILLARQAGFELPADPETAARFTELRFLERNIGATGLLAMKPVFHFNDHDLWQYHLLDDG